MGIGVSDVVVPLVAAALVAAIAVGARTPPDEPLDGSWDLAVLVVDGEPVAIDDSAPRLELDRGTWTLAACSAGGGIILTDDRVVFDGVPPASTSCDDDAAGLLTVLTGARQGQRTTGGQLLLLGPGSRALLDQVPAS